ncbi:fungal-specific transcription factor domain-containing protein [Biscogniauxia mediterranea]|nr:fungal-specific transcription factor domain-containing protein [Biscogniauxia mediterranea]
MEPARVKVDRRRRRPALACVSCRRSKIRCDRGQPCGACIRSRHKTCVFEPHKTLLASRPSEISPKKAGDDQPTSGIRPGANNELPSSPGASPSIHLPVGSNEEPSLPSLSGSTRVDPASAVPDATSLLERVWELERRLKEFTARQTPRKQERRVAEDQTEDISSYIAADIHTMQRSIMSKTRYFGQSHWMNGLLQFRAILELFESQSQDRKSEAMNLLNKCKSLGRTIKAQRMPELSFKFGTNIPPRERADKLVDYYLRTFETVFRVLHVPSFRSEYEKFWASPGTASEAFIILLQLVMAVGATFYDKHFSLRKSALQWMYEGQCWLLGPVAKSRMTLTGLQIMLLLGLARENAGLGGDLVWISVGSLTRMAMYMGLHRDPARLPGMTKLTSELRRRLWNTILEMELQTSIDSGGPPMLSLNNSDTTAPANVDDDQLIDGDPSVTSGATDKFTDTSVALALRESFSARLAIARLLNNIGSKPSYEDTLRLHAQLSTVHKSLSNMMRSFAPGGRQPTEFQRRYLEFSIRRYYIALHIPYSAKSMKEPAYAFSRKALYEAAMKTYCAVLPSASLGSGYIAAGAAEDAAILYAEGDDLARLSVCCAGPIRSVLSQASTILTFELQHQLQEDDSIGLPTPRAELVSIIRHSEIWFRERLRAGETNMKGYMFVVALRVFTDGLSAGWGGEEIKEKVLRATIEAERESFEIFKQAAGQSWAEDATAGGEQVDWDAMMGMEEDWNASGMNVFFDFTSVESGFGAPGSEIAMAQFPSPW